MMGKAREMEEYIVNGLEPESVKVVGCLVRDGEGPGEDGRYGPGVGPRVGKV